MGRPPRDPASPSRRRNFFATDAEWSAWKHAATLDGAPNLSAWIVGQLNRAAKQVTKRERSKRT